MPETAIYPSDVAFTPAVKAVQSRKGSRHAYERLEARGSWQTGIPAELKVFIEAQRSIFLATASRDGQPTIQHRGGPPGFMKILDDKTIAFVDFAGNRQYITLGNLSENPKAHLFLIDYAHRRRIKIWGTARVEKGDGELVAKLMPKQYKARPEQDIILDVTAWDSNCPQHISLRFGVDDVAALLAHRDTRIRELEGQIELLLDPKQPQARKST